MSDFAFVFSGTARDLSTYYGVRVTSHTGIGMPPTENVSTDYAIVDGAAYQRTITRTRVIQLSCVIAYNSQYDLHAKRKSVISAINRDALRASTFTLRYTGGASGITLNIPVRYDGGMEMERAANDPMQPFAIRLVAYDPYWTGATTTSVLGTYTNVADAYRVLMRTPGGAWSALGGGLSGEVYCLAVNPYHYDELYVGGVFTTAYTGSGQTTAITVNGIAAWTGLEWSAISGGVSGSTGAVRAIAFGRGGEIYVGGEFTTAGTAAANNIACYKSGAWQTTGDYFGSGVDGSVRAIVEDASGYQVYVGGTFTTAGGSAGTNSVAACRGSTWYTLHSGTMTGQYVYALISRPGYDAVSDEILMGGGFSSLGPAVTGVAKYTRGSGLSKMGVLGPTTGFGFTVVSMSATPDGNIYAGGFFGTADGAAAGRVARWNGSQWTAVGNGIGSKTYTYGSEYVRGLAVTSQGNVYAACPGVTTAGRVTLVDQIAQFDGAWHSLDCDLPGSSDPRAVVVDSSDNLYVGFDSSGTAVVPGITILNNPGTADAYPTIAVKRVGGTSATIQTIVNSTTGHQIVMPYALADGETVTIELFPGMKSVTSDFRGDVINYVLPSSDIATWCLAPGNNTIRTFITESGGPTITAVMTIVARYWSADG